MSPHRAAASRLGDVAEGLMRCSQQAIIFRLKFAITVDRDEDGMWVVECPSVPGCVSQGKTRPEALKNIREAIELCMEVRAEGGLPLTVETQQVEVAL
jgi:predicted RNase H-like HicB family nuclease